MNKLVENLSERVNKNENHNVYKLLIQDILNLLRQAREEVLMEKECAGLEIEVESAFSEKDVAVLEMLENKVRQELEKDPYAEEDAFNIWLNGFDCLTYGQAMHYLYGIGPGFYAMPDDFDCDEPAGNTDVEQSIALEEMEKEHREAEQAEYPQYWNGLFFMAVLPFDDVYEDLEPVVAKPKLRRSQVKQKCRQAAWQSL